MGIVVTTGVDEYRGVDNALEVLGGGVVELEVDTSDAVEAGVNALEVLGVGVGELDVNTSDAVEV